MHPRRPLSFRACLATSALFACALGAYACDDGTTASPLPVYNPSTGQTDEDAGASPDAAVKLDASADVVAPAVDAGDAGDAGHAIDAGESDGSSDAGDAGPELDAADGAG